MPGYIGHRLGDAGTTHGKMRGPKRKRKGAFDYCTVSICFCRLNEHSHTRPSQSSAFNDLPPAYLTDSVYLSHVHCPLCSGLPLCLAETPTMEAVTQLLAVELSSTPSTNSVWSLTVRRNFTGLVVGIFSGNKTGGERGRPKLGEGTKQRPDSVV